MNADKGRLAGDGWARHASPTSHLQRVTRESQPPFGWLSSIMLPAGSYRNA